ncbi:MAG: hypothetical protein BMS9Abin13_118 [Patescibacteria group bacterium]|nr:MAG: hypothetical protein BMS9Abin13_118 [Patescibacteria group bacterium]
MEQRKDKKELKDERQARRQLFKKIKTMLIWVLVLGVLGVGIFWLVTLPKVPQSATVSQRGIHWHPSLSISIKGEEVAIPGGIGLGAVHSPMHTHDPGGIIHLEYSGIVRENDIMIKNFFDTWGKDFSRDMILGNRAEEGGTIRMFVGGEENMEFEKYMMQDGDVIEILYEE